MKPDHRPRPAMALPRFEHAIRPHSFVAPANPACPLSRRVHLRYTQLTLRNAGGAGRASHLPPFYRGADTVAPL